MQVKMSDDGLSCVEKIYTELDRYFVGRGLVEAVDVSGDAILMAERLSVYIQRIQTLPEFRSGVHKSLIMYKREHRTVKEKDSVLILRMLVDEKSPAARLLRMNIMKSCRNKTRADAFASVNVSQKALAPNLSGINVAEEVKKAEEILDDVRNNVEEREEK